MRKTICGFKRTFAGLSRMLGLCAGFVAGAACAQAETNPGDAADLGFRSGLSEMNAAHYEDAMRVWRDLADKGDPRSETGLGFMYHRGLGVPVDDKQAAYWLRRAAEHGQAEGQLMLGSLYFFGYGVPQSYVRAFAWCELAQDSGQPDASECRDAALQSLPSNDDMQAAFRLSVELRDRYGAFH